MARELYALVFVGILIFLVPGAIIAQAEVGSNSRIVEVDVPAPALASSLLETASIQSAAIYLPSSYANDPDRRYPVIYLLHGIFDNYEVWIENYSVQSILDRLITSGLFPEAIVVMPNGGNQYGGGFYRNSPVSGRWGDYIAEDLVGFVDGKFRTIVSEESRAIAGHSMGGYGALHLAMTRPGLFSVVWALSPCCLAAEGDFGLGNDAWKRAARISTEEDLEQLKEASDFFPIALLGVVTAFSPDVSNPPFYARFPFSLVRGEVVIDDTAYNNFLDVLPLRQVHSSREALRNLRGLAIDVGLGDQFVHIPTSALSFSQQLGAERIPHLLDIYAGDHRQNVSGRLEHIILPWIGEHMVSHR